MGYTKFSSPNPIRSRVRLCRSESQLVYEPTPTAPSFAVFSLSGSKGSDSGDNSGNNEVAGLEPSTNNQVLRLFQKPFKGDYANSWSSDHDLPFGQLSNKTNSTEGSSGVLTGRGETTTMRWGDGGKFHNGYDWSVP
ncbi:hypothetical protein [Zhongshania sp.]|uniref:hypothetical protein n=1 Tax=Zhongshania sp. TaxID=1971902 RepID=UPI003561C7C7